ncbi:MAG: ABC transporter permease [Marinoscillum sp.]
MSIFFNLSYRTFLKSAGLNSLNILGLSLGIIAALLILVYADHEYSYDGFHTKAENIYRLEGKTNGDNWFSNLGIEYGRELGTESYPEVKSWVRVNNANKAFFHTGDHRFAETSILQTNPGSRFFEFFTFEVLEGSKESMLSEPYSVVLTASTARKYFGKTSPVGEILNYDSIPLKVTGVLADLPSNTHLSFDLIYTNPSWSDQTDHFHVQTYLQLVNEVDSHRLVEKILGMDLDLDQWHKLTAVQLMPLTDVYMKSHAAFGSSGKGDPLQLRVFIIIGILILLIAMTNYINLSQAIYLGKGRAVGVRKVFGESRMQIIKAFIYESIATVFLCAPFVLIGFSLMLPVLNLFLGVQLENKLLHSPGYLLIFVTFLVILAVVTVIYPAIALSSTNANTLMKSKSAMDITGGKSYRNGLIFLQFILLFTLGISGWFMNRQIQYLDSKDKGFDATNVIKITNAYEIGSYSNFTLLKSKLMSHPEISGVAFGPMMGDNTNPLAYKVEGSEDTYENLLSYGVDIDYFDVMGMNITHGDFKNVLQSSEAGQIVSLVNHSFINRYGWEDDPIGKKIILRPGTEDELHRKVSGVFNDFHFFTFKEKITPQIISLRPDPQFVNTNILIRANTRELSQVINLAQEQWYDVQPNVPLEYELMDDAVRRLYEKERQTGQLSLVFSSLAIGLSVLGLVGFMIYMIGLKSKELTMRKVLGASLIQIITVLNKSLVFLVLTASIFGSLLSYWMVNSWLQDYAYAIDISLWVFPVALFLAYCLIFSITAIKSAQWARTNPALTLSEE